MRRPRVLLIAEAANPEFVSVPLEGWSLVSALREVVEAHIVTQVRNRDAFVRAGLVEGVDFTSIDSERVARPIGALSSILRMGDGKGWTTVQALNALSYPYFESLVWKQFGRQICGGHFDIVHRVTPISPTIGSKMAPLCKKAAVPFVIGPMNGGVPWPKGFDAERRREKEWLSYVRGVYRILPGVIRTMSSSSAIIAGSRHTESEIPSAHRSRSVYILENGIDPARFSRRSAPASNAGPLRIGFVGRMVPYKGPDMLIDAALPLVREGRIQIEMIGDGPMLAELKSKAAGLGDGVRFHGWIEHSKVQDVLAECDVFGFPSVREFGGAVVLEAMALGIPPIVIDYAGPGETVTEDRGYKIALAGRERIVLDIRRCLSQILANPADLSEKAARAHAWVHSTATWAKKAEQVTEVYDWVLGGRSDRPNFSDIYS